MAIQEPAYWGHQRFHSINSHFKQVFGEKVFKLSLDAGFTCPNRDGSKGIGGCTFCSTQGSGDFVPEEGDLHTQMRKGVGLVQGKWQAEKYIAYFQAFTNTYAPIQVLVERYHQALQFPGVVGLAIATRPDCLDRKVLELLQDLNEKTHLWVEIGVQSSHNRTLKRCNTGYTFEDVKEALANLAHCGIRICTHVIFGLPGEEKAHMLETIKGLQAFSLYGIKLQMLNILQDTALGREYQISPFPLLSQEEYVDMVVSSLEYLSEQVVVHRLTGDGPKNMVIAPQWIKQKRKVLAMIDAVMKERNTWQGKYR